MNERAAQAGWSERIYYRLLHYRAVFNRHRRLLFPSPAELRLIELMGGRVLRFNILRDANTKFPLAFVVRKGRVFKAERVKREVRYGNYYVDFANDLHRIIEVDGAAWHMDVVADFERELYIKNGNRDVRFLRISAAEMHRDPNLVQRKVLMFLND